MHILQLACQHGDEVARLLEGGLGLLPFADEVKTATEAIEGTRLVIGAIERTPSGGVSEGFNRQPRLCALHRTDAARF
jgi:hypothetical protein